MTANEAKQKCNDEPKLEWHANGFSMNTRRIGTTKPGKEPAGTVPRPYSAKPTKTDKDGTRTYP